MTATRSHLAWLMWCYQQGYTHPDDRAILTNWLEDDPDTLTVDDREAREHLLLMADEILEDALRPALDLIDHARKISPSERAVVYVADLERALGMDTPRRHKLGGDG